jgi:hypothetical protein
MAEVKKQVAHMQEALGQKIDVKASGKETVTFVCKETSMAVIIPYQKPNGKHEDMFIEFRQSAFTTNDEQVIKLLREHQGFDQVFWEGGYPAHIKDFLEKRRSTLTKDIDEIGDTLSGEYSKAKTIA